MSVQQRYYRPEPEPSPQPRAQTRAVRAARRLPRPVVRVIVSLVAVGVTIAFFRVAGIASLKAQMRDTRRLTHQIRDANRRTWQASELQRKLAQSPTILEYGAATGMQRYAGQPAVLVGAGAGQ